MAPVGLVRRFPDGDFGAPERDAFGIAQQGNGGSRCDKPAATGTQWP